MSKNTAVIPFMYESKEVRTIKDENGNPWFVAKDVADILEIEWQGSGTLRPLEDDEKGITICYTPGGKQEMLTVSESGLYALIFRSNKPEAKKFRKWVTAEVLPQIRKTGTYTVPAAGMKLCSRCGQPKPFSAFDKNPSKHDGYQYSCKECCKEIARLRYNSRRKGGKPPEQLPHPAESPQNLTDVDGFKNAFEKICGSVTDADIAMSFWKVFHGLSLLFINRATAIRRQNINEDGVSMAELWDRIERLEIIKFGAVQGARPA